MRASSEEDEREMMNERNGEEKYEGEIMYLRGREMMDLRDKRCG